MGSLPRLIHEGRNVMKAIVFTIVGALLTGCNFTVDPGTGSTGTVASSPGTSTSTSASTSASTAANAWEAANPIVAIPTAPLGIHGNLSALPSAPTPQSVRLGRWLFFDPRLSVDNTISCSSCHEPAHDLSSATAVATGVDGQQGTRKPPPLLNLAFVARPFFFWDGRADSLEEQATGPIENPIEMGMTADELTEKLQAVESYPTYFEQTFQTSAITMDLITKAVADYERTRMSGNSAFDNSSLSPQARQGFALFGQVGCNHCHNGQLFSDSSFHNTGVAWNPATQAFNDPGRFDVTSSPRDEGAFKTPTLRNLSERAPYFHNGSAATLRDVVVFYSQGGVQNPNLDPAIHPLNLSENQIDALVAFLQSLEGTGYEDDGPTAFPQ